MPQKKRRERQERVKDGHNGGGGYAAAIAMDHRVELDGFNRDFDQHGPV